jgi:hypothetical protein
MYWIYGKMKKKQRSILMLQSKISRRLLFSLLALAIGSVAFLGLYLLHFSYTENLARQTADLNRNARIIEILLADELS